MAVRMAGFALGRRTEHGGDVIVAFDIRLLCEIEIPPVRLQFAGEGVLQIGFGFAATKRCHIHTPFDKTTRSRSRRLRPYRPARDDLEFF